MDGRFTEQAEKKTNHVDLYGNILQYIQWDTIIKKVRLPTITKSYLSHFTTTSPKITYLFSVSFNNKTNNT